MFGFRKSFVFFFFFLTSFHICSLLFKKKITGKKQSVSPCTAWIFAEMSCIQIIRCNMQEVRKSFQFQLTFLSSSQNRLNNNDNEGGMESCHSRLVLGSQFTVNKHFRLHQLSFFFFFFFHSPSTPSNDLKFNCDLCKNYKIEKSPDQKLAQPF